MYAGGKCVGKASLGQGGSYSHFGAEKYSGIMVNRVLVDRRGVWLCLVCYVRW